VDFTFRGNTTVSGTPLTELVSEI